MNVIVPAVLPQTRADLEEALTRLGAVADVTHVQIDLIDGTFAKPATWPYPGETLELPHADRFRYDLDLMVMHPEQVIEEWITLGATRITVHAESTPRLRELIAEVKRRHGHEAGFLPDMLAFGVALNIDTDLSILDSVVSDIDYVQCMGIARIGRQGEPFDPRVLRKIRALRAKHPTLVIQIDGGVSRENARALFAAGANRLVVGSALLRAPNLAAEFAAFKKLYEESAFG